MSDQYVWLLWSSLFLIPWGLIYFFFPIYRKQMWWSGLLTLPFGLTEPLFVPSYWNPPTLFNLAQNTGFDIESLIFCFGIGGISVVLYNLITKNSTQDLPKCERHSDRHRYHLTILLSPFFVFLMLIFFKWNAIYPGIIAMLVGGIGNIYCRPDLFKKTWIGGLIFVLYYFLFLTGLEWISPGYIERYWMIENLTGFLFLGFPIEEFLFAFGFGFYWSSVYEHVLWKRLSN